MSGRVKSLVRRYRASEEQLAQTRSRFPWLSGESTHLVRSSNDRLLWWTFAGLFANSAIAEAVRGFPTSRLGRSITSSFALGADTPHDQLDIALEGVRARWNIARRLFPTARSAN